MDTKSIDTFQEKVKILLSRNRNLLDILTKCQTSTGRISRSTVKAATGCGCIKIIGKKTEFDIKDKTACIEGVLCKDCRSNIENEIGESLFYIASLCNALNISMDKILSNEIKRVETLGKYSLH